MSEETEPIVQLTTDPGVRVEYGTPIQTGAFQHQLTPSARRDLFAAAALQGLLSDDIGYTPQQMAKEAVQYADALIAELDKPKGET